MNDNEFWIKVWKIAAFVFVVTILNVSGCTINKQSQIRSAIEKGTDPIAAKCAIDASSASYPLCIVFIAQGKPNDTSRN